MLNREHPVSDVLLSDSAHDTLSSMSKPLKSLLQQFIPQQAAWRMELTKNWQSIIGNLYEHVRIHKIYNDALVLAVKDSSWLQELYLLSPLLIETINKNLDKPRINRLHFKNVGDFNATQALPTAPKVTVPTRKKWRIAPTHITRAQQEALDKVEDKELREALKQLLFACKQGE